ncbi:MAG TPA: peptide chain release factor N(5)-glutamine methyltransferase [Longimicrobiaceae bacterium]|nr:peptide chain release factor N(5)-glutamine methyltransferase [Longimicrobiaceae bacterium]
MNQVWTTLEIVRWTSGYLEVKGFDEPRLNAELLLAGVLGLKRLDLYLQFDRPLGPEELAEFKSRLRRRLRHEPIQYIEGVAHFRGLELKVDQRVLIPRPETEVLVGEVLAWAGGRDAPDVLDLGTGSGAIALSLRQEGNFGRVIATDLSEEALHVARGNRDRLMPDLLVEFRCGNGLAPVAGERFDVIVSNAPYVGRRDGSALPPEVREWEPSTALFAGEDGLDVIRHLIDLAPDHLRPGGLLALEIGAEQGDEVATLVRQSASFGDPSIRRDLAGRERILLAEAIADVATLERASQSRE